ncbi:hypothetical protein ACJMK2_021615 [Sinanodonta woodiana]|uniref:C-type lectin domain-containing protein n=1 Tax=Sinanodonta woodiana TaxID=1069815 RepID=A0ABD3TIK2_SINWO
MNLVQIGFLSLALPTLADGFLVTSRGGFGGISGIFGILLLLLFIAALAKKTNTCPANYTQTPNDPTTCIRFFSTPTKAFLDADTVCVSDGGYLLKLSTATFPSIQQLTKTKSGGCNYWVGTQEYADGSWHDRNDVLVPDTPGLFFIDPTNGVTDDCGLMNNADDFFLIGAPCDDSHCYICQKSI